MKAVLNIRHGARFRQFFRVLTTSDAETEAFSEEFDFFEVEEISKSLVGYTVCTKFGRNVLFRQGNRKSLR